MPVGRARGAKLAGLRFERALGKALPCDFEHGSWFSYRDFNGHGFCQPDFLLELEHLVVVLEAKYTWTPAAYVQIELLYKPVVQLALGKPVIGIQICKRLLPESAAGSKISGMLGTALVLANQGHRVTLHWPQVVPIALAAVPEAVKQALKQQQRIADAHAA
jgi:hypothetical protein